MSDQSTRPPPRRLRATASLVDHDDATGGDIATTSSSDPVTSSSPPSSSNASTSAAAELSLVSSPARHRQQHDEELFHTLSEADGDDLEDDEDEADDTDYDDDDDEESGQRIPLLNHGGSEVSAAQASVSSFSSYLPNQMMSTKGGGFHQNSHHSNSNGGSPAFRPLGFLQKSLHLSPVHQHKRRNGSLRGGNDEVDDDSGMANGDSPPPPARVTVVSEHGGRDLNRYPAALGGDALPGWGDGRRDHYDDEGGGNGESSRYRRGVERYPKEPLKTVAAGMIMLVCMITTMAALALVHEIHPETPPLPDQILDSIEYQKWALAVCERLISVSTVTGGAVVLFHKHRFIVARRCFLIVGLLYLYRAVTLWVTALPNADPNYECAPKLNRTITFGEVASRVWGVLQGFGLTINGKHVYCGDYIYSGHAMVLIVAYLIVKEYTPRRMFLLHWLLWLVAAVAIVMLLFGRGHYTVDVVLAYFVSTRTWATYHTIVNHVQLKEASSANHFSRYWWFAPVRWMEKNVKAGPLPNEFNLPIPGRMAKFLQGRLRRCCRRASRSRTSAAAAVGVGPKKSPVKVRGATSAAHGASASGRKAAPSASTLANGKKKLGSTLS